MVQILCMNISQIDDTHYQMLYRAASPHRQQRADSYRNREDAVRCIASEILLRTALKRSFGSWDNFSVSYTEHGKPYLEEQPGFHFSISHSGHWAALAYGSTELGLDIQQNDPRKLRPAVVKRFFTQEEQSFFSENSSDPDTFFRIWTAKESYLKYLGTGLSKSLTSFSVLSPEDGLHYFWESLPRHILCLCTRETEYLIEQIDIKNAPA